MSEFKRLIIGLLLVYNNRKTLTEEVWKKIC
jgi:hypothetical protein